MLDWPTFGYSLAIFFIMFLTKGSNNGHLFERLANCIMISEEHWKTDKQSFQNVKGHTESVN